jgi:hypothetical protein
MRTSLYTASAFEFCESMYFAYNNHRLNQTSERESDFSSDIIHSRLARQKENLHENYRKKSLSCLIIYAKMIFLGRGIGREREKELEESQFAYIKCRASFTGF